MRTCGQAHFGACLAEEVTAPEECGGGDDVQTTEAIAALVLLLKQRGIEINWEPISQQTPRQTSGIPPLAEKRAGIAAAEKKLAAMNSASAERKMKRRRSHPQPQQLTDVEWSVRQAANELVRDFDYVVNNPPPNPYEPGLEALRRRNERR